MSSHHGAGLDDGEDAGQDPGADQQLPLLAQMEVDVVQDHWQQDAAGLWRAEEEEEVEET